MYKTNHVQYNKSFYLFFINEVMIIDDILMDVYYKKFPFKKMLELDNHKNEHFHNCFNNPKMFRTRKQSNMYI